MEVSLKQTHQLLGHFKVKKERTDPICLPGLFQFSVLEIYFYLQDLYIATNH